MIEHMGSQPSKRPGLSPTPLSDHPQLMPPKQLAAIQKPENGWPDVLQPPILEIRDPV